MQSSEESVDAHRFVFTGTVYILLSMSVYYILVFLSRILLAHAVSLEEYGLLMLFLSVVAVSATFAVLGISSYLPAAISRKDFSNILAPAEISGISAITVLVSSFAIALILALASSWFPYLSDIQQISPFLFVIVPYALLVTFNAIARGFKAITISAMLWYVGYALVMFSSSLIAYVFSSDLAFFVSYLVGLLVLTGVFAYVLVKRGFLAFPRTNADVVSLSLLIIRQSLPILLSSVSWFLLLKVDVLMVGAFLGPSGAGLYAASANVVLLLLFVFNAFNYVYLPVASGIQFRGGESLRNIYSFVAKWSMLASIPLFAAFFFTPDRVLSILYGATFSTAANALTILSIGYYLHAGLGPVGLTHVAIKSQRSLAIIYSGALFMDVLANFLLIPRMGLVGAAIATVISILFAKISLLLYLWLRYRIFLFTRQYFCTLFAVALSFVFSIATMQSCRNPLVAAASFILLAFLLSILFGCIDKQELRYLRPSLMCFRR